MRCPFPGMDPYLERPAIWPDFHDSLIIYLREVLQPMLRPRYAALSQNRRYVVESDRPFCRMCPSCERGAALPARRGQQQRSSRIGPLYDE